MSERDYYEVLGVAARRERGGDQEGVPRPRARASPGRQQARPRRGGALQGGGRRLRGAERRREARRLRPLRPRGAALRRLRAQLRRLLGPGRHLRGVLRSAATPSRPSSATVAPATARGEDIAVEVDITLEEVAHGVTREVEVDSLARCSDCNGNGAEPGTPIVSCSRCQGTGQLQSVSRTPFGQLVRSQVCDHCRRRGPHCGAALRHLRRRRARTGAAHGRDRGAGRHRRRAAHPHRRRRRCRARAAARAATSTCSSPCSPTRASSGAETTSSRKVDVPFTEAALGATVQAPTLEGDEELKLEQGTQPSTVVRLRGRGLPSLRGRGRGDLHVIVSVMVPRNLSDEQRAVAGALRASRPTARTTPSPSSGPGCSTASATPSAVDPARTTLPQR